MSVLSEGGRVRGEDQGAEQQTYRGETDVQQMFPAAFYFLLVSCSLPVCRWLTSCVQAESRAETAERSVAKLEKTIDDLEGETVSVT